MRSFTLLFLALLYHEMHIKDMIQGLKETVCTTASIMLIVSAASVFSWILTKEQIPQALTAWMLANIHSKFVFLIVVNIFLLIVGMFIEGNASMIILVPLLAPIAKAVRNQRDPVCNDLHLQQRHRRIITAYGNADVRNLLHYKV